MATARNQKQIRAVANAAALMTAALAAAATELRWAKEMAGPTLDFPAEEFSDGQPQPEEGGTPAPGFPPGVFGVGGPVQVTDLTKAEWLEMAQALSAIAGFSQGEQMPYNNYLPALKKGESL